MEEWEKCVKERPGNFTKTERNNMLLSAETRLGLKITCKLLTNSVDFLLIINNDRQIIC